MFEAFPKLHRLYRDIVISEKIDGTNAQVFIFPACEVGPEGLPPDDPHALFQETYALAYDVYVCGEAAQGLAIAAGSRSRYITPDNDNFGFASWVRDNAAELFKLGKGRHFGEWWGRGIQRGYGLDERRFSLFNPRWHDSDARPACCHVVPTLYTGSFDQVAIDRTLQELALHGSRAALGYPDPEGVVVYHSHANQGFKITLDNNDEHKWKYTNA